MIQSLLSQFRKGGRPDRQKSVVLHSERNASMQRLAAQCCQLAERPRSFAVGVVGPAGGEGASLVAAGLAKALMLQGAGPVLRIDFTSERRVMLDGRELSLPIDSELIRIALETCTGGCCLHFPLGIEGGPDAIAGLRKVMAEMRTHGVSVVLDLPAVQSNSAAFLLASDTDGVLLVLEAEVTRWEVARAAQRLLEGSGARIFGSVLNKRRHFIPDSIYRKL